MSETWLRIHFPPTNFVGKALKKKQTVKKNKNGVRLVPYWKPKFQIAERKKEKKKKTQLIWQLPFTNYYQALGIEIPKENKER